jgi:hypothetical protein
MEQYVQRAQHDTALMTTLYLHSYDHTSRRYISPPPKPTRDSSHDDDDTTLLFESRFESGSLRRAMQVLATLTR